MKYIINFKLFESDKGWEEVTSSEYWTDSKNSEPFTKHEIQLITDLSNKHHLRVTKWGFGSSIRLEKESNDVLQHVYGQHKVLFSITIVKSEDEWFWVSVNTIGKIRNSDMEDYYKADQVDGLMNLLELISLQ